MSGKTTVLRFPSLRAPIDILFLVCCIVLTADVLVPELWGSGKTKDYPLWFWAGQQVLQGKDLYPNAMTGSGKTSNPWLFAAPGFATITFVFDMFDLGQPNLMLLAMMLYGFWLLQHERPWMAGSMFALATAIKVFPIAVLPYLIWRRHWASVASTVVFVGVFLFVVPAPVRGFQHNVTELKTWYQGMVGTSSEKGFGQRDEQNWSWVNQSIIAVTHRLTRPVNYNQDDPNKPPRTMNVVDISFQAANWVVIGISIAVGLGYLAVMPPASRRTERSDAEELGILFCLMTVASPLARQYYFMWLFFPIAILVHRAAYDPRPAVRIGTWLTLAVMGILMCLSFGVFPKDWQAYGNNLAATAVIAGGLVWHILHPPKTDLATDTASSTPPA